MKETGDYDFEFLPLACNFSCFLWQQTEPQTWLYWPVYFFVLRCIDTGKIQLRLKVLPPDINSFVTILTPVSQHIVMDCLYLFALYTPNSFNTVR